MLSLDDLGAVSAGHQGSPRRIVCTTADAAVRLLAQLADEGNHVPPANRVRVLCAVIDWILDEQQDHADELAGMLGLVADAGRRVAEMRRGG